MTTHPGLSQLLALMIKHRGLTITAAAPLLGLSGFMTSRLANRLVILGYATRGQAKDQRYFATISGFAINAVMRPSKAG